MKQIKTIAILIFVALLILALTSCGVQKEQFILGEFTSNVTVKSDNKDFEGTLIYQSPTQINFTVTKPQDIAGIEIEVNGSDLKMSCGDLTFTSSPFDRLTKSENIFKNLFEALGSLGSETFEIDINSKQSLQGEYTFGTYTAIVDGTSKKLTSIDANGTLYIFS
ncbi:MAG: hypothetical protein NC122_00540 [Faecalibacterium sp.]|nr:hypothetical protein [Ruminococcus sp.]MCM1392810.1 hypothetical protein [Ruminococcus sp.]MCM1484676.1 hypothetical protein [Faecalibacterium sp.]